MYKYKRKYYKVINANNNCTEFLLKRYRKALFFYIKSRKPAFWVSAKELFKKYTKIN